MNSSCFKTTLTLCLPLFFAALCAGAVATAKEVLFLNNDLRIERDFSPVVIPNSDRSSARVYFRTDETTMPNASPSEYAELVEIMRGAIKAKNVQLVETKSSANYMLQVNVLPYGDRAIRNRANAPSRALVLISLCKLPINEVAHDCENLTYFFFSQLTRKDMLLRAISNWTESVIPDR